MNTQANYEKLVRLAAIFSVMVAVVLVLIKFAAWWSSGSVSLLAGLTDSLLDGLTSSINLLAVIIALKPADKHHRYGHGKAEALAGLAQSALIMVSAVLVAVQAVRRLQMDTPVLENMEWGMAVIFVSLVLTCLLLIFQHYVIEKTGSTAIMADSLHYRSDVLLNLSILIALILSYVGWQESDAILGLLIAVYIFWSATLVGREAIAILMDEELPEEVTQEMLALASAVTGVIGVHDLRTRKSGNHWFVQLHVELPAELSLVEAHNHCLKVRNVLQNQWPQTDVTIHADPR